MQTVYVITIVSAKKPTVMLFENYEKAKSHYDEIIGFASEFGVEIYFEELNVLK